MNLLIHSSPLIISFFFNRTDTPAGSLTYIYRIVHVKMVHKNSLSALSLNAIWMPGPKILACLYVGDEFLSAIEFVEKHTKASKAGRE